MAKKDDDANKLWALLKKRPEIIVTLAAALGFGGEQISELANSDVPGWTLGIVVILLAGANWAAKLGKLIIELVDEFKAYRKETAERFKRGDDQFTAIIRQQDVMSKQREVDRAEIAAHAEEIERIRKHVKLPTDKVDREPS